MRRSKTKEAVLHDSPPNVWACECGQMNLRDDYLCCICGGDREENWEETDRDTILRQEQWDTD